MPSAIRVSEDEMTALGGLPHLSVVVYLLGIRPRMDFGTGTVGERPLVSWQALREVAYVEPHQGVKHDYASVDAVRRAVIWLEKAGLVQMRSRERQLIFYLPLAHRDQCDQKKAAKGPPDQAAKGPPDQAPKESTGYAGFPQQSRQPKNGQAAKHPVSGKPLKPLPPAPQAMTTESASANGGQVGGEFWIFPRRFTPVQRAAAVQRLHEVTVEDGQAILDEVDAGMREGTIRNLPALLEHFVDQAKAGRFMPDKGLAIRAGREAEARVKAMEEQQVQRTSKEAAESVQLAGGVRSAREVLRRAQRHAGATKVEA